ncbi:hypothetical protein E8E14_005066 [Neopestalotiopsis sp. 37M]|nr:hypothetical protein E8E14_005066 [Neopestalotiopsis sp. 37M]
MLEMGSLLRLKVVWLLSLFYFFELGAAMTASGWVVEFLTTSRGGDLAAVGYVPAGFSGGLFLGRILLAEPTFRWGEQRMLLVYSVLCAALQLVFWLQPNVIASATALSVMGFLFGPFFATGMSVASKLLPKSSQAAALGFIFVMAQAGGAIFPSITGVIATSAGVAVLQPIVLALIIAGGLCCVPFFPDEDSKLRASSLTVRRGGNCPNSLEVLQQLLDRQPGHNVTPYLISALPSAESPAAAKIRESFGKGSIVNLEKCIYHPGYSEPASSYIIRSEATGSRTLVNYNDLPEATVDDFKSVANDLLLGGGRTWWHFEVGAGDTFIAGMLFGLLCHEADADADVEARLRFAVQLATCKVEREGFSGLGRDVLGDGSQASV